MAIRLREKPESRELHFGSSGGGQPLKFTAITTAGETEVQIWLYALANTPPLFNGFIRNDLKVMPRGGPVYDVDVEYGTTGVGGGDQPLGGAGGNGSPPPTPTAPADPNTTPLASGWSFSIRAPRLHITQSRQTLGSFKKGGGTARDFKGRVGVDRDLRTVGVDWPPDPAFTFKRTIAKSIVTLGYLETLAFLAGRMNNAPFYGFAAGEVLFLEADGQFTENNNWSISFGFGVELNDSNIIICEGLPTSPDVISKRGWDYLWVTDDERPDADGLLVAQPKEVYVEELIRPVDFTLLEIGA